MIQQGSVQADYLKSLDHRKLKTIKELYNDLEKSTKHNSNNEFEIHFKPGVNLLQHLDEKTTNMLKCQEMYET